MPGAALRLFLVLTNLIPQQLNEEFEETEAQRGQVSQTVTVRGRKDLIGKADRDEPRNPHS